MSRRTQIGRNNPVPAVARPTLPRSSRFIYCDTSGPGSGTGDIMTIPVTVPKDYQRTYLSATVWGIRLARPSYLTLEGPSVLREYPPYMEFIERETHPYILTHAWSLTRITTYFNNVHPLTDTDHIVIGVNRNGVNAAQWTHLPTDHEGIWATNPIFDYAPGGTDFAPGDAVSFTINVHVSNYATIGPTDDTAWIFDIDQVLFTSPITGIDGGAAVPDWT